MPDQSPALDGVLAGCRRPDDVPPVPAHSPRHTRIVGRKTCTNPDCAARGNRVALNRSWCGGCGYSLATVR
jgi:hypothetical protein